MEVSSVILETIEDACKQIMGSANPSATAASLMLTGKYPFVQPGAQYHDYYEWRLGQMRNEALPSVQSPSLNDLAAIEDAVKRVATAPSHEAEESQLLSSGTCGFMVKGHPLHDFYMWRLSLAKKAQRPKKTGHITVTLNSSQGGNTPISMGQLLVMLAPIIESGNTDPGIFCDPNGHLVIPSTIFDEKSDVQEF
eukprot:TRINITY_DN34237_c0_g1_i1.p1 TRINITY_DN34237_c0_g1~~TRINITY_DN34237_c0_g1_i1.p1  ORF type:complete len:208 (+),score=43.01 TRINITY_DN34237_c0_g1_i1:41-625(+)